MRIKKKEEKIMHTKCIINTSGHQKYYPVLDGRMSVYMYLKKACKQNHKDRTTAMRHFMTNA